MTKAFCGGGADFVDDGLELGEEWFDSGRE